MSTAIVPTGSTQIETAPLQRADQNPAAVYLASLGDRSRRIVLSDLNVIARLLNQFEDAYTLQWQHVRFKHVAATRSVLAERYAPATANRMLSSLRGVLRACWQLNLISTDDYHKSIDVKPVKGERLPSGRSIAAGEMRVLFELCGDGTTKSRRDAALLAVLYASGMRREEAVNLDLADYDAENAHLIVRSGKGNKDRTTYLADGAVKALEHWIDVRGSEPGPLFYPVLKGGTIAPRRMTDQAVFDIVKRLAASAGLKEMSPHDLRRSFVSDLLDAGADISAVQKLAGHASPTTTARYDRRGEQAKRRSAKLLHVPYGV